MNIWQEISIPGCFVNFRGKKLKNCAQAETESYILGFGDKSKFDRMTSKIFKQFKEKQAEITGSRSYFSMFYDYNEIVKDLD